MRLLFLSQVLPYPLDAGPKMRSYYVLRQLVQRHEVTLVTFVRDTDRPEDVAHLAKLCRAVHTVVMRRNPLRDLQFLGQSFITGQPFLIVRDYVAQMDQTVRHLLQTGSFDAVHADQLWMAQYALAAKQTYPNLQIVLDQHNAVYLIPRRMAEGEPNFLKRLLLAREARALTTFEADVCRRFDQVVWVTAEDRRAVAALAHPSGTDLPPAPVIPICADPEQVAPVVKAAQRHRITFLGGLHWPPNAQGIGWFAQHVFPLVRAQSPQAVLTIIGKNPPAGLPTTGVEVTGYVADLTPYLAETAVFVVPLHAGGGMRVKILDAWSWGLPIVSTTIGAEGIVINPGTDILIADTAAEFARCVGQVLTEPDLAQKLSQQGRQTVLKKYNWRTVYTAWDDVYSESRHDR